MKKVYRIKIIKKITKSKIIYKQIIIKLNIFKRTLIKRCIMNIINCLLFLNNFCYIFKVLLKIVDCL